MTMRIEKNVAFKYHYRVIGRVWIMMVYYLKVPGQMPVIKCKGCGKSNLLGHKLCCHAKAVLRAAQYKTLPRY